MFLSSNLSVFFLIHAPFVLCDSFIFFCGSGAGVVVPVDLRAEAHIAGRFGLSHPTSRFDRRIDVVVSIFRPPISLIFGFYAGPDGVGKCESWSYCARIDGGWCCCFESPPFALILTVFFLWSCLVVAVVWRAQAHIAERFVFSHPISLFFV
jgi:hypothetical protein